MSAKDDSFYGSPRWLFLLMIGRLRPGVSEKQALAQLNPVYQRVIYEGVDKQTSKGQPAQLFFTPVRGMENLRESYQEPLIVLMTMVGVVLLIACSNVAMLLVARNTARQREFSVRLAVGASGFQLFRQLFTESLLLVAGGTALGWVLATWATEALAAWSGLEVNVSPDRRVWAFTLTLSALAALLFGLVPLRSALRGSTGFALQTSAHSATGDRSHNRTGQMVVAFQISLCLALLVCASLLLRTLRNLETLNLGLHAQGLLVFGITPPPVLRTEQEVIHFYQSLIDRLRALPGVESATLMGNRIGSGWSNNTSTFVDGTNPRGDISSPMRWNAVGPDYFHVLGIPIIVGRDFTDQDSAAAPKVAIINRTFAQQYLAGREPLGHHVAMGRGLQADQYTVVGVVQDSKYTSVREEAKPMAYFPYTQISGTATMHVEVRTESRPVALLPVVVAPSWSLGADAAARRGR